MSKAILVIDMPNKCGECSLRMAMICTPTMKDIDSVNAKMEWCPLRKVPQKWDENKALTWENKKFIDGRNACIDEIMRGAEENG